MAKAKTPKDVILENIDKATEPDVMSKEEAISWLKELAYDIEVRVEALVGELKEAQEGGSFGP